MDAELLLSAVLGVPRARLLTLVDVADDAAARFADLVEQRASRVPLQHLTGTAPSASSSSPSAPGCSCPGRRPS